MGTTLTNQLLQKQTVTIPLKRSTKMHVLSIHLQVTKLQSYRATAFWFLLFSWKTKPMRKKLTWIIVLHTERKQKKKYKNRRKKKKKKEKKRTESNKFPPSFSS